LAIEFVSVCHRVRLGAMCPLLGALGERQSPHAAALARHPSQCPVRTEHIRIALLLLLQRRRRRRQRQRQRRRLLQVAKL
jgi:hypothetical protein